MKLEATMQRPREQPIVELERVEDEARPIAFVGSQILENQPPTDKDNWRDAEATLVNFFAEINAGNYAAAAAIRTPEYLIGTPEAYAAQLKNSMENDISGKLKITEIEQLPDESKLTTKYFRFRKDAVWTFDKRTHSEIRKAALVLRDGEWTIDFFEIERKF